MSDVNFITGASFDPDQTTEISFLDDDLSGPFWQILVLVIGILSVRMIENWFILHNSLQNVESSS